MINVIDKGLNLFHKKMKRFSKNGFSLILAADCKKKNPLSRKKKSTAILPLENILVRSISENP